MGIGFVLLVGALFGAALAAIAGKWLALVVAWSLRTAPPSIRRRFTIGAAFLPGAGVVYAGLAFLVYSLWCETCRGVDPGLGDCWRVPVVAGYSLEMIDTPDHACLVAPGNREVCCEVSGLAVNGSLVVGSVSDPPSFFVLESRTGELRPFSSEAALGAHCRALGTSLPSLQSPEDFYHSERWGLADVFAALVLGAFPLFAVALFATRLVFAVRGQRGAPPQRGGT